MIVIYHLNFTQNSSTQLLIIILTIIVIPILSLNGWGEDKSSKAAIICLLSFVVSAAHAQIWQGTTDIFQKWKLKGNNP